MTGGAGFIGSFLCERLLEQRHEVLCVGNFFTGARANILHLMDNHRFELVRHEAFLAKGDAAIAGVATRAGTLFRLLRR